MTEKSGTIKNPLTVIAIFAGIAEVSATVVLPMLEKDVQEIFIYFVMAFPVFLVSAFFATLNWNHKVLYAPSDFKNEEYFLKTMVKASPEEQKTKLEKEIKSANPEKIGSEKKDSSELSDKEFLALELKRQAWVLSEELVLRKIESEIGESLQRQAKIGNSNVNTYFDGLHVDKDRVIAVEVKLVSSPTIRLELWETIVNQADKLRETAKDSNRLFTLILAVVTDLEDKDHINLKTALKREIQRRNLPIELRTYRFDELQETFGIKYPSSKR